MEVAVISYNWDSPQEGRAGLRGKTSTLPAPRLQMISWSRAAVAGLLMHVGEEACSMAELA